MNPERTIHITHKNADGITEQIDVKMLYCAASETGYQDLSGKTMDIFIPKFDIQDGKAVMTAPPAATDADYIKLATACIVAAYQRAHLSPHRMPVFLWIQSMVFASSSGSQETKATFVPRICKMAGHRDPEEGTGLQFGK